MSEKELTEEEKHKVRMDKFKNIFKIGFKYYLVSILIVTILMFLHYPPLYYTGTTASAMNYFVSQERYSEIITFVAFIFIWSIIMIPLLLLFKGKWFGKIFLAIFSIFVGFEKYLFYIQGENTPWNSAFNRSTLETFLSEANLGGITDAYTTYAQDFHFYLYLIIFPILIFISIYFLIKLLKPIKSWISLVSLPLFMFMLTAFSFEPDVPYIYKVPVVLENYVIDSSMEKLLNVKRHDVLFKEIDTTKKTPQNIIFVMDESIRGDLISINNPNEKEVMQTTPFLYSMKDQLINFGDNYSMGNCSQISNMLFMSGFHSVALKTKPMIFQYMRNAGYETFLIDSPHSGLIDGFYHYDKEYIDNYITVRDNKKLDRDKVGLKKLKQILRKPGKKFIYMLKQGAHFPFDENYNKEAAILPYDKKSERGYLNTYLNALNIAVDNYLKELVLITNRTDSVVLWQGDHGVNVVPDKEDKAIKLTHCEVTLTHYKELYNVMSIMYSPNKEYYKGFKNLRSGYSTSHMLPTLLDFAGYKTEDIVKNYTTTYKNPDKNVSIHTGINFSDNPLLPENITTLENIEKNGIKEGYIDSKVNLSPLNKRRVLRK